MSPHLSYIGLLSHTHKMDLTAASGDPHKRTLRLVIGAANLVEALHSVLLSTIPKHGASTIEGNTSSGQSSSDETHNQYAYYNITEASTEATLDSRSQKLLPARTESCPHMMFVVCQT